MVNVQGAVGEAREISALLKAGDQLRHPPQKLSANYERARRSYDRALRETVVHLQKRHSGTTPYSRDEERRLSKLWSDASIAMADFDPAISNACFIKGQGWLDPAVWKDPQYTQFRIGIDDMRQALMRFNEQQYAQTQQPIRDDKSFRAMEKIKILIVSANPSGTTTLKLDEEVREIDTKIRASEYRDSMEIITKWAARPDDLLQSLLQYKPHVVHFSGHGSSTEEIILLDKNGKPSPVSKKALVSLFRTVKNNIRVVLLNACFSEPQALAITEEIDCAIGMTRAIGDHAAITFAASFYRAVGFGCSVKEAFDHGITALLLEGIPEEQTPLLMTRKNTAAEALFLINPQ